MVAADLATSDMRSLPTRVERREVATDEAPDKRERFVALCLCGWVIRESLAYAQAC